MRRVHKASAARGLRLSIALLSIAVVTAACGNRGGDATSVETGPPVAASTSEWDEIVEAANEEGELTLYWSMGEADSSPHLFETFEKAYPDIEVNLVFQATGDLINRLDEEISGKVASADTVVHASPLWFSDHYEANDFAALQVSPDNQAAGWDARLDGKSYATWWGFQYVLGYNTGQPKPAPDLKELLDANPDAKIGLVDPHASQAAGNVYETLRQAYGDEILDQLANADYTIYENNSSLSAGFGAGSVDYAYPDQVNTTGPLIKKGAPLAQLATTKAQAGANYNVAIPKTAPHPNAAQVWANFVMSESAQAAIVEDNAPAGTVPMTVENAVPWDTVTFLDPDEWTTDKWNAWIEKYWTPRFG